MGETSVAEREIGEFEFVAHAAPPAGTYREYFRPVVDGISFLRDLGIYWDLTVTP